LLDTIPTPCNLVRDAFYDTLLFEATTTSSVDQRLSSGCPVSATTNTASATLAWLIA
jgi:hypothetical protein